MDADPHAEEDAVAQTFVARYRAAVTAVVSGFDRLVFRGTLLPLVMELGMRTLLARVGVRLHFGFIRARLRTRFPFNVQICPRHRRIFQLVGTTAA